MHPLGQNEDCFHFRDCHPTQLRHDVGTEQVIVQVTFRTGIREVRGSNLSQGTAYPDIFCDLSLSSQPETWIIP